MPKKISVPTTEMWDSVAGRFYDVKGCSFTIEHSLISVSKWESKWKVPYMTTKMTQEMFIDYVKCMTLTQVADPRIYSCLTAENKKEIMDYLNDSMTATFFNNRKGKKSSRKVLTSEYIYYMMAMNQVPMECQKWHFNRLLVLLRIFSEESTNEKMTQKEIYAQNRALNNARRAKAKSKG